ncbi:hypothetical protein RND81_03G228300 [Saponaria officinalis]|uniref:F-box domain-containing protein n=1 Tax=Saponaria officinalis TaxID=3572 RepID=A0AAW1M2D7_SAPOF
MINDEGVESKHKKPDDINGLVDEMVVEILCRLPCHKSVVICKAVCKHWAALVSRPFFIRRFVAYKNIKNYAPYTSEYDELTMKMTSDKRFGRVVRKMDMPIFGHDTSGGNTYDGLMICFNDLIHNPKNVSVSYLPRLSNRLPKTLTVVGACNDLLLHRKYEDWYSFPRLDLCISNAQTKQWVELPPLHLQHTAAHIGLICDPYYSNHTTDLTLNDAYMACVIVILRPSKVTIVTEFFAHIFSPNTGGMWRNVVLSLPLSCEQAHYSSYFCIGRKYYFRCYKNCLIGFDPFVDDNGVIKCDSLHLPSPSVCPIATFGVFHKQLYICEATRKGECRMWALEDFETSCWSLRYSITSDDWIPRDSYLVRLIKDDVRIGKPIGFHPANPDVVYMLSRHKIILCNLRTRDMEVACELPEGSHVFFLEACPYQFTLPIWPSPLPTLGI